MKSYIDEEYDCIIMQAKYLKSRIKIDEARLVDITEEFMKEYFEICKTVPEEEKVILEAAILGNKKKSQELTEPRPEPEIMEVKTKKRSEALRKVYKEIAKKTHPDTLIGLDVDEQEKKKSLFQGAQEAIDESNLVGLLEIAEELDIEIESEKEEQIEVIKKNVKQIKKRLKEIKETTAWQWFYAENDEDKHDIMLAYMQHMYMDNK